MARFLAPKITEKPKKIDSKRHHKIDQFLDWFLIDFCSVLDAKLIPCWPPFSAQDRPRGLQDASKTVQDSSQDALDRPSRPKTPPKLLRSLPDLDFCSIFRRFLVDFGWFLFDFWLMFWSIFCRCLIDFSSIWDVFKVLHGLATLLLCSWRGGGVAALLRCGYK